MISHIEGEKEKRERDVKVPVTIAPSTGNVCPHTCIEIRKNERKNFNKRTNMFP
jgi:hypothetical protein